MSAHFSTICMHGTPFQELQYSLLLTAILSCFGLLVLLSTICMHGKPFDPSLGCSLLLTAISSGCQRVVFYFTCSAMLMNAFDACLICWTTLFCQLSVQCCMPCKTWSLAWWVEPQHGEASQAQNWNHKAMYFTSTGTGQATCRDIEAILFAKQCFRH